MVKDIYVILFLYYTFSFLVMLKGIPVFEKLLIVRIIYPINYINFLVIYLSSTVNTVFYYSLHQESIKDKSKLWGIIYEPNHRVIRTYNQSLCRKCK